MSRAMVPAMESPYLNVNEVAGLLRVDPNTVRRWCASGQLVSVKLGDKLYRIDKAELDRFVGKTGAS